MAISPTGYAVIQIGDTRKPEWWWHVVTTINNDGESRSEVVKGPIGNHEMGRPYSLTVNAESGPSIQKYVVQAKDSTTAIRRCNANLRSELENMECQ